MSDYPDIPLFDTVAAVDLDTVADTFAADAVAAAVAAVDARRDCSNGGQMTLPAEFLPIPEGAMFA